MRLYGKHFLCEMPLEDGRTYDPEYVALSNRCNGKSGLCLTYSLKANGDLYIVLQIEDRMEVVHHSRVRFHPDEMKALEEDLIQVVKFNRQHPDSPIGGEVLDS